MDIRTGIINILFPIECTGCRKEDVWLCNECLGKIPLNSRSGCFFCGREGFSGATCPSCARTKALDGVLVCADYQDKIVNELIKKLKYSFVRELGKTLASLAADFLKQNKLVDFFGQKKFGVIPIPLHKKRLAWRGFNQTQLIAESVASQLNLKFSTGELIRAKNKTPQAKLGGEERRKNIKDCFAWRGENLNGRNILLIDDVATTGSTLGEAAAIVKAAGAGKVWGLVIAKG